MDSRRGDSRITAAWHRCRVSWRSYLIAGCVAVRLRGVIVKPPNGNETSSQMLTKTDRIGN